MKQLFIIMLLILAACSDAGVRTVPTSNYTPTVFDPEDAPVNPCAAILCAPGQTCLNGECICQTGKACANKCIASNACCTNSDCATQNCVNNTCAPAKLCNLGEQLINGECECSSDRVFCREQNKCIKKGDCCYFGQCPRFQRCQPTTYRASLCIQIGEKKSCKSLGEIRSGEFFQLGNFTANAQILQWLSDGSLRVDVSGKNFTLLPKTSQTIGNATIYQEGIDVLGGKCEPDESDDE